MSPCPLESLDARSNKLGGVGAAALLRAAGLRELTLFDNPAIGADDGAARGLMEALAALPASATLLSLDLGACQLGIPALVALCAALRAGAAGGLRCLELFGNGDESSRDAWKKLLGELSTARPDLDVAWKEPAGDETPQ